MFPNRHAWPRPVSVLFSQAVAERVGLNPTALECLGILVETGPIPAGRLAEMTGLTTGAITGVVDRLEEAGFVRRERDPNDRRRVIVRPLSERLPDVAPFFDPLQRAMAGLYARYSDQELALIIDFTARANAIMREEIARLKAEGKQAGEPGQANAARR